MDSNLHIDAAPEKTFYLSNGKHIRNLSELVSELEIMSNDGFTHHCNAHKDDFATWIDDALKLKELATLLKSVKDKDRYLKVLKARLYPPTVNAAVNAANSFNNINNDTNPAHSTHSTTQTNLNTNKSGTASNMSNIVSANIHSNIRPKEDRALPKKIVTDEHVHKVIPKIAIPKIAIPKMTIPKTKHLESDNHSKELAKLKAELDELNKTNSELAKKLDDVVKANSELSKKIESLSKAATESQTPNLISKEVSKHFEDSAFKNKITGMFKDTIIGIHSKDRDVLKSEIKNVMDLNAQLDKKLEISMSNRAKYVEKIAHSSVSEALKAHLSVMNKKVDNIMDAKIPKLEQAFDKRVDTVVQANLLKFKNEITKEKHDLRAIASDVMHKEFEKVFNDDEHLAKIVARYQKMFNDSAEHVAKVHKEYEDKFNDDLLMIRGKIEIESQNTLNRQLVETIKKQRDVLDSELAKALNSNKFFVARFEKEVLSREKMLLESADRKLKENYSKHEGMLSSEFNKYYRELRDLKIQFDKEFKEREGQFNDSINSKIHESLNKEFNDILVNQRNELAETISTVRVNAINKISSEFNDLLSKHKHFMLEQFNKATTEQASLKEKFVVELKTEEEKVLAQVKELTKKDIALVLNMQRDLLDNELSKTVLANKYFVERFEKEIIETSKKLSASANAVFEENYAKHKKMMEDAFAKHLTSMKTLITDADTNIANKESKIFTNLNAIIPASVREAVNKEFSNLIIDEKKALEIELQKAKLTNDAMEKKFSDVLQERSQEIIDAVRKDADVKFGELMSLQQSKFDQELLRARKSYDMIEGKKNEIIDKANSFLENMNNYSTSKLKELEREHDKHLKKVSQITVLITKAENALNDVKELKTQVNADKKVISKESKEYSDLMNELNELRNNLAKEKNWIVLYREKVNVYNMIHKCSEYIKSKDSRNAQIMYNKIADAYANTPFEHIDKAELFHAANILLNEMQNTFGMNVKAK
ncbi:MAG: hypothetical protein ACP5NW_03910 [Candidatus Woesearchaeota archaeon]